MLRSKADAEERGEDVDREKNWEWTIEENDAWEKKLARKARRADFEFHGGSMFPLFFRVCWADFWGDRWCACREAEVQERSWPDQTWPCSIQPPKRTGNGSRARQPRLIRSFFFPGVFRYPSPSFDSETYGFVLVQVIPTSQQQQQAAENLYRDANNMLYGDNKPSEDAIDRVVGKINQEYVQSPFPCSPCHSLFVEIQNSSLTLSCSISKKQKFSRKRPNEDEGDITYINERNRVFNKKIGRYYDKYTKEIRDSFERGTAL